MAVLVVSTRTVSPPPPRHGRIPLTTWDVSFLSANYIQKGLLYLPPSMSSTAAVVDHLAAALSETLAAYYPVAGRFVTDKDPCGGCSVSIDCGGQGVELIHAVADGVSIADVIPPDADVPRLVQSFFPLDGAVNHDGHELPLLAVQVTELAADGAIFLGFAYNHALSDGTAFWAFLNAWAQTARSNLNLDGPPPPSSPLLDRWSPDGGPARPIVLPCADVSAEFIERLPPPLLRERMLHFSAESLRALKERAGQELLAAGDTAGAAALTRFQALSSLLWRSITRARNLPATQPTVCRVAINNRGRLEPPLPPAYFGNSIYAIGTEPWVSAELLEEGSHGRAAAAVGRAVAAHTDGVIRAKVAAWMEKPVVYNLRFFDRAGTMMGSSPRFDMYGCDFGWGRPLAARSGKGNKSDGKTSLYPSGRDEGGMDAELTLTPENMAALELDEEFWAAVSPDEKPP
ncbi:hypothetical protein BRADI_1g52367v3, partial [Brachypodium distachyon]